ncbi:hypothetical protein AcdelDRAFT_4618, partial [Acidovorax delafieldii 2AN]
MQAKRWWMCSSSARARRGLAASAALAQQGIRAVLLDRAPRDHEGPWATTARMETLRSP